MKNIVCFGDSNTYGYNADENGRRFPIDIRWTGRLQKKLGEEYRIIEEGLSGRTTIWADETIGIQSGAEYVYSCISSHKPIDLFVIMLGTNDMKERFSASPFIITCGLERIINIVQKSDSALFGPAPKKILIIAPPHVGELNEDMAAQFAGAQEKSKKIAECYEKLAKTYNTEFFDASLVVEPCATDGIHLDAENHEKLAEALCEKIKSII